MAPALKNHLEEGQRRIKSENMERWGAKEEGGRKKEIKTWGEMDCTGTEQGSWKSRKGNNRKQREMYIEGDY